MNKLPERIRIKDIARLADVSVGTVDRVIHGRSGVSEASKKRVEEILKQLDYQPNMYASALASNKKYTFICLLPEHLEGEYWTAVETGIHEAIATYSDFNTSVKINYYDPYDYHSFENASEAILALQPDGVMVAPTAPQYTKGFTDQHGIYMICCKLSCILSCLDAALRDKYYIFWNKCPKPQAVSHIYRKVL